MSEAKLSMHSRLFNRFALRDRSLVMEGGEKIRGGANVFTKMRGGRLQLNLKEFD